MSSQIPLRQVPPTAPQPGRVALAVSPSAHTMVFDAAPVFSNGQNGLAITLTGRRYLPDSAGGITEEDVVVGFLRCSVPAAMSLRKALDAALLLARPTPGGPSN